MKDETKIAFAIPGTYYFDQFKRIFHVICSESRFIMLCYLAESINNQLGQYAVQNLLPLASILDSEPIKISSLLNELRIRALPGDDNSSISWNTTKSSFDSAEWEESGQDYAIAFYKWLGYTNIYKQDTDNFHCTGLNLSEIKVAIKNISYNEPHLHIQETQWSNMAELGKAYELIIIAYQGENIYKIIKISEVWDTLKYAESKFRKSLPKDTHEFLINFYYHSEKHPNDLILNWHKLLEIVQDEKIQHYHPISSNEGYEPEIFNFKLIEVTNKLFGN